MAENSGYSSRWEQQLEETLRKILDRQEFSYDLNADALYRQYRDSYVTQGRRAMEDTMGRAAALTGGYGNSYARSAGQQAYQGYLQQLHGQIPQLQQGALSRYEAEGERLLGQASLLARQEQADYDRYRTELSDRNGAFDRLLALMTGYGYRPTEQEMTSAGMTENHLQAILGTGSSGGGKGGTGGVYDPAVAKRQRELNALGADLTVDGIEGPKTRAAEEKYGNTRRPKEAINKYKEKLSAKS